VLISREEKQGKNSVGKLNKRKEKRRKNRVSMHGLVTTGVCI